MDDERTVRHFRWEEMEKEPVKEGITRRIVTGDRAMLAHIYLDKGASVPTHAHENEQITYLLEGVLKLWVGEERQEVILRAGEVLHIPPNVPHAAEAMEDCVDVDIFSPPRQDWLDGTDDYLREK